jgi:hypothetical protein
VHDLATLRGLLSELETRFESFPPLSIDWIDSDRLDEHFGCPVAAACHWFGDVRTIVISDVYRQAPLYVLRYLILHEALHVIHPPRGREAHHRVFRIAEQCSPDYLRGARWIHLDSNKRGVARTPDRRKSAYWRKVLAPVYGGDTSANYARYVRACSGAWLDAHAKAVDTPRSPKSRA